MILCAKAAPCSVPVFRYALERWAPSIYDLWIFHQGALTNEQIAMADELDRLVANAGAPANVTVQWVDIQGAMSPDATKVWREQQPATFPHATLVFAPHGNARGVAYQGPADLASLRQLIVSPLRQEIVRRLLDGDSAVWLLIESGDAAKDSAALTCLTTTLATMADSLQLPAAEATAGDVRLAESTTPLHIKFPVVRVARSAPEEQGFIQLLTSTFTPNPPTDQPVAIAVSGQGRALAKLSGDEIDPGYISAWCDFIAGPCSCQVKAELPGSDLLIAADWTKLRDGRRVEDPVVPSLAAIADATKTPVRTPIKAPAPPSHLITPPDAVAPTHRSLVDQLALLAGASVLMLLGFTGWRLLRRGFR
jgi:hypothetical protein